MTDPVDALVGQLGSAVVDQVHFRDERTLVVDKAHLAAALDAAIASGFSVLTDLTTVDCHPAVPRFEVVYLLTSFAQRARLRLKVRAGDGETVPSATGWWPGANWLEREVYDLFGIRFDGHPSLTRILLPDDWEGHPLRKDYALVEEPVQFVGHTPKVPSEIIPKSKRP